MSANMNSTFSFFPLKLVFIYLYIINSLQPERRVLDFSECETPAKGKAKEKEAERGKSSAALSFPSPSSYLMKGCR